jgi:hypothetical protein
MFKIGTSIICIIKSNYRIAATLCVLGTWFSFRNMSVNTVHKEEEDNNDDNTHKYVLIFLIIMETSIRFVPTENYTGVC